MSNDTNSLITELNVLKDNGQFINSIAWSPDGKILASTTREKTVQLWDTETGILLKTIKKHPSYVLSLAWSPDGTVLVSGSNDGGIRFWDVETCQPARSYYLSVGQSVSSIIWSYNGKTLVSGSYDHKIRFWDIATGQCYKSIKTANTIFSIAWSPDEKMLASISFNLGVQIWNPEGQLLSTYHDALNWGANMAWSPDGNVLAWGGRPDINLLDISSNVIRRLEGHISPVTSVSFSKDGNFLASKSQDGTVYIWRTSRWEIVATLNELGSRSYRPCVAFHPTASILAAFGDEDEVIRLWNLDTPGLLGTLPTTSSFHYTNAKIILVGDSGVGKSGLGLVLAGKPFVPTESTHGRYIWDFQKENFEYENGFQETRETLLWDLAGQPGYRLIHQLHLSEVAVALVVFDAHSETNPFAGVDHWVRALRVAEQVQADSVPPIKKFLVAARIDRGRKSISRDRIDDFMQEWGFDGYIETSAKERQNITTLADLIRHAIDWNKLPKVTSTYLFQKIKDFLISEKKAGRLLSTRDDLYRTFLNYHINLDRIEGISAQFMTCIDLVASQGLIKPLSFGNLVLLKPELLDSYASALVNAVLDEPDGLGSILEEKVRGGFFLIPEDERIVDKEQEKLLLIAMIEDLLRYEIVLREQSDDGTYLVFPSQSTRENPSLPNPEGQEIIFSFEGPVLNIYATLAVRLSYSGFFRRKDLWQNAVTYTAIVGGHCGIHLSEAWS